MEGTHEAIITREMWDSVHKLMQSKRRECSSTGEVQMFAGLVKCAGCGSSLNVSYDKRKEKYTGFSCWVYKNYGKNRCTSHAIGWQALNRLVLEDIRRQARHAALYTKEYLEVLSEQGEAKHKQELDKWKKEMKAANKHIAELDKIIERLYEDRALGRLLEERYQSMMARYEAESCQLKNKKAIAEATISQSEKVRDNARKYIALISEYTDIQELSTQILIELIEKIVVHEKVTNPDGQKSQRVDIHYKFVGIIRVA